MPLDTPVLLLTYKRPDTTQLVFNAIRQSQPSRLYVCQNATGSRDSDEQKNWKKTREIINQIDWGCDVKSLYRDQHLNLKESISSAIDWFFDHEEMGIILEDDCVPDPSFFRFCAELLERYFDDERIMSISGDNFQFGRYSSKFSYYFSRYNHIWGWASWRRAWKHYDINMRLWPEIKEEESLFDCFSNYDVIEYWKKIFDDTYLGQIDTWDYQWLFACWVNSGFSILPNVNLISNIGFRGDATHTKNKNKYANMIKEPMVFPLAHPKMVIRSVRADRFTELEHYGIHRKKFKSLYRYLCNERSS